jgi:hypothetical protein
VYYALCEQDFTEVAVINPAHAKALKGHKTDAKDWARHEAVPPGRDRRLAASLGLVRGSGSRGSGLAAGGPGAVHQHCHRGRDQFRRGGDQGDLPAGHAVGDDHMDRDWARDWARGLVHQLVYVRGKRGGKSVGARFVVLGHGGALTGQGRVPIPARPLGPRVRPADPPLGGGTLTAANAAGAAAASPSQAQASPVRTPAIRPMRRMMFMTVSFALDEFTVTVWPRAVVPDRERSPQVSRGVPYIPPALARPSLMAWDAAAWDAAAWDAAAWDAAAWDAAAWDAAAWEAAAWRVEARSFPSTAETWWSIVLAQMNSFAPISALVYPAERMLAVAARADRDRADVQSAQRTTDDAGGGGAEILADAQGLAKAGSSAASSMARRVARAADLVPQLGRAAPVATEL